MRICQGARRRRRTPGRHVVVARRSSRGVIFEGVPVRPEPRLVLGLAAAAGLAVSACAGAAAPAPMGTKVASAGNDLVLGGGPVARPPLAVPGERMLYRVSIHGFELAEFSIAVGELATLDGAEVVIVQSAARTTRVAAMLKPVEDVFTSWISTRDGRSLRFVSSERASKDDDRKEVTEARLGAGTVGLRVQRGDDPPLDEEQVIAGHGGFDLNSFLVFLRGWEAEPGARVDADVVRSRYVWRVQMEVVGYENLSTALGNLPAVRYDGEGVRMARDGTTDTASDRRRFSIWLSDDADRVPVRLVARTDYGDIEMALVAYEPGDTTGR